VDRLGRRRSGLLDGLGGQLEQDLSREGVVATTQGGQLLRDGVRVLACAQTEQTEASGTVVVLVAGASLAGHGPNARSTSSGRHDLMPVNWDTYGQWLASTTLMLVQNYG
jgi:hypothetical protein